MSGPLTDVQESMKDYYGKRLRSTIDQQLTTVCSLKTQQMPQYIRDVVSEIHDDIKGRYYGCGLTVPTCLEGMKIVDLGSGSGRDCFALSKLVGEGGFVTGIDMTDEQLDISRRYIDYHTKAFGYDKPNVDFVKGYIENLKEAGIKGGSIDILISNCVINLCKDKKEVLSEAFRVLKDGGELYFSDVYADRVLSEEIRSHEVLWGEGLGGALYWKQLFEFAKDLGFETPRAVTLGTFEINDPKLKSLVGDAKYISALYRLFKLPKSVDRSPCKATYKGTIPNNECSFKLDENYSFEKGKPVTVDGDTAAVLRNSRFQKDFELEKVPVDTEIKKVSAGNPFLKLTCGGLPK